MSQSQHELTLTIRSRGREGIEAVTRAGGEATGTLDLDELRQATIAVLGDLLRRDAVTRREELEVLGQHLHRAVFTGDIPTLFRSSLDKAKAQGQRLRVQLSFKADVKDLLKYPWEFLFDRELDFLATRVDLVLSRYMPTSAGRSSLAASDSPLRVLVAVARVKELPTVVAGEVIEKLEELQKISGEEWQAPIEVVPLRQTTRAGLIDALQRSKPHVFHFIGHGVYEHGPGRGRLALQPEKGDSPDWCDDNELVKIFEFCEAFPRLVVLHMCEGGAASVDEEKLLPYTGFGPKLIRAGIPAVVAMQYPIKNSDASSFARAFYEELAKGGSVDVAVQRGRERMGIFGGYSRRLFGTPVLYMHSSDGVILPKRAGGYARSVGPQPEPPPPAPPAGPSAPIDAVGPGDAPRVTAASVIRRVSPVPPPESALVNNVVNLGLGRLSSLGLPSSEAYRHVIVLDGLRSDMLGADLEAARAMLERRLGAEQGDAMRTVLQVMLDALPR